VECVLGVFLVVCIRRVAAVFWYLGQCTENTPSPSVEVSADGTYMGVNIRKGRKYGAGT
jgi:hypothetical protein